MSQAGCRRMHGGRVSSVLQDRELRDIAVVRGPRVVLFFGCVVVVVVVEG